MSAGDMNGAGASAGGPDERKAGGPHAPSASGPPGPGAGGPDAPNASNPDGLNASGPDGRSASGPRPERRRAVIALGGNMGDRVETLRRAMRAIDELDDVTVVAASSLYETPAMTADGIDESAPRYLNAVVIAMMSRRVEDLLHELLRIEDRFGRQRVERWGSRTLDLDLIDVDGMRFATDTLQLPHPHAWQRAFVLAPWHEIDPEATLAGHGPIADLLAAASDRVELFATSGLEGRSAQRVSTDRGLPLIGPDSRAEPPRPIRGGTSGFGSNIAERAATGHDVSGHSGGSDAWRAGYSAADEGVPEHEESTPGSTGAPGSAPAASDATNVPGGSGATAATTAPRHAVDSSESTDAPGAATTAISDAAATAATTDDSDAAAASDASDAAAATDADDQREGRTK